MATKTIKAIMKVEDKFSTEFAKLNKGLSEIQKQNEKTNKGLKKTTGNVHGLTESIKGFVGAYLSWRSLNAVKELALLGAEADSVADSFDQMGARMGFVASKLTEDMRTATDNMVDDLSLQKNAMRALISGIDPDDMLVAMQYVSRYANSVGQDANQLMQTVMTGLARGSAQFLDDVGIQVMGAQDVVGDAIDQMKDKMLDFNENSFAGVRQFEAQIVNLRMEIGKELLPALDLTVENMQTMAGVFDDSEESLDQLGDVAFNLAKSLNVMANVMLIAGNGVRGLAGTVGMAWSGTAHAVITYSKVIVDTYYGVLNAINENPIGDNLVSDALLNKIGEFSETLDAGAESAREFGLGAQDMVVGAAEDIDMLGANIIEIVASQRQLNEEIATTGAVTSATSSEIGDGIDEVARLQERLNAEMSEEESIALNNLMMYRMAHDERMRMAEEEIRVQELEKEARLDFIMASVSLTGDLASAMQNVHSSKMQQINDEFSAQAEGIKNSTMSEKKKAKELERLESEREKAEVAAQKRQVAYTAIVGAANTALAIQKGIMTVLDVGEKVPGGPLIKGAAMLGMAGVVGKYIGDIKSAQAQIPNREHGGAVRRGELYEVAENGKDELFESGGKSYLLPSQGGRVHSGGNSTSNSNVTINANFNGGDMATIEQRLPELVAKGMEMADRQGMMDYGGMQNFNRAVGN